MDIRDSSWHMHLKISGVAEPIRLSGSAMELMAKALQHMRDSRVRIQANGAKEITLRLSDNSAIFDQLEDQTLKELESTIDSTLIDPDARIQPGESESAYQSRLQGLGYSQDLIRLLSADAFGSGAAQWAPSSWITDPRAIRFRALHASQSAYDSADPQELASLLTYCLGKFASELAHMRLRS